MPLTRTDGTAAPIDIRRAQSDRLKARIDGLYRSVDAADPNAPDWSQQLTALWSEIRETENRWCDLEEALENAR